MQGATFPPYPEAPTAGSGGGFTNAGVGVAKTVGKGAVKKWLASPLMWLRLIGRLVQLVFALIVCGFYGTRVARDSREGHAQAAAWVYALFVAVVSGCTAIAFAVPFLKTHKLFYWDLFLFVLWIAVFGTFAGKFLNLSEEEEDKYEGASVGAMKTAVWIDLLNCFLWLGTAAYGFVYGWTVAKGKGLGHRVAAKTTDRVADLEAQQTEKFKDRHAGAFEMYDQYHNNPVAQGVAGKVGGFVLGKAKAHVAGRK